MDDHDCPKCGGAMAYLDDEIPPYWCPVCDNEPDEEATK